MPELPKPPAILVNLETTDLKDKQKQHKFSVDVANKILSLSNSKWILKDSNATWNGTEIVLKPISLK